MAPRPQGPGAAGWGAGAVAGAGSGAAPRQSGLPRRLKFGRADKRLPRSTGQLRPMSPRGGEFGFS